MIQVQNIRKDFGAQNIFDDASFLVGERERIGIVGRNGSGKSTLFKLLLNEEALDAGKILIPKNYTLGYLRQHIQFSHPTVHEEACSVLRPNEDGWVSTHEVEAILFGLGFDKESLTKSPHLLSGGFQIRLNLAKVLAASPDMLLLDEPTNYLDIVSTRWLARFLKSWKGEILLITHDRHFMDSVCTHTLAIFKRQFRKMKGSVEKLYTALAEEEEVERRTQANDDKKREQLERVIDRFRYKASKAAMVQSKIKAVERLGEKSEQISEATLDFAFTEAPFPGKRVAQIKSLNFAYENSPALIENFSLEIFKGERIAVIGPNGRGKTTLLNLFAQELRPNSGEIILNPNVKLNYFGQTNINRLNLENTVEEEIQSAIKSAERGKARNLAGLMMFSGDAAEKKIKVLSGGERSRVLLAKILATECNLLLLDEPTNHLDVESIESLLDALKNYGGTSVIVSHDEALLHAYASRLIVFDGGKCFSFEGTYQEFLQTVGWSKEKDLAPQKSNAKPEKESRQARAEYIAERSRKIKPLEKKVGELEQNIHDLETLAKNLEIELIELSNASDGMKIVEISKRLDEAKKKTEQLFEEWENACEELEKTKEAFPL